MPPYAINVRAAQIDSRSGTLKLPRLTLRTSLEIAWREVLLYASRDEGHSSYYGVAIAGEPMPIKDDTHSYKLPLYAQRPLQRPLTVGEIKALGFGQLPFYVYSNPIRVIEDSEHAALLQHGSVLEGFGESKQHLLLADTKIREGTEAIRLRALRFEMFEVYGPRCIFTGRSYPSLNMLRYGIDVGHILPRAAGGPDIIQNIFPMCKDANNQWDEGLISMWNNGDVLIAKNAGPDTYALLAGLRRVVFPKNMQFWPDAQYLERHRDTIFEKGPAWLRPADF